ncbi:nitroreductase family protein [Cognatishimia sp. 1_MG-2023]|uniref:nitroreductase family protein n=1 Tax=Cognatishimia sp. 1_MG-2023 TaxID=3062642 RepID=UPI0026E176D0|nr:nitroreductase family protein [Cognatishimia sp. 1_MG-2023]MDO6726051.1 nitroreductase family protein [Cognatishimia sp. 1_MG-2023]
MPERNPAALEFLLNRRSRPAKTLTTPVPDRAELEPILTAALRTPDHGKLEPWRLIVLERDALARLGDVAGVQAAAANLGDAQIAKARNQFDIGNLAVVVVESPVASDKVPAIEQTYSAGAVCLALLNAALAAGWGANWLSGWATHDRGFVQEGLGLAAHERVAGIIHIGTEKMAPPERPRPNPEDKITWQSA